jgi:ABC-type Fe3+-hydroxamate transport system substrate-binding protein
MASYTDQLNHTVHIPNTPQRIISLVPSQTELLFDLGLDKEVVGITKFCIHPKSWFRNKQRIGGTKNIDLHKIAALQPDLIIANKEENVKEQVEELAERFPVWVSDVNTLEDALEMITTIGDITGKLAVAKNIAASIQNAFHELVYPALPETVAYLIWKNPHMTTGNDTFIHHMLTKAGYRNAFEDKIRYPIISIEDLQQSNCRLLFLSSEPYPFKQTHIDELQQYLPETKILLVDGEMFSWYGSRLLQAPSYFKTLRNTISTLL